VRIGQDKSRHQRAVKVWDKREFKNLDDTVEIGTRNIKVALRRLRKWAREGAAEELDSTARSARPPKEGYIDIVMRPERRNAVKLLMFLDIGGSMDPHIKVCEELFSRRAPSSRTRVLLLPQLPLRRRVEGQSPPAQQDPDLGCAAQVSADYKVIFVGDASMSPYEITYPAARWSTGTRSRAPCGCSAS
jgi:uncharacterized protein with von Willebrand factor type A (vWA) domain